MVFILIWLLVIISPSCLMQFEVKKTTKKLNLNNEVCSNLPRFCRYVDYRRHYSVSGLAGEYLNKHDWLTCECGFDTQTYAQFESYIESCKKKKPPAGNSIRSVHTSWSVTIRAKNGWQIVNNSFYLIKLVKFLKSDYSPILKLLNLRGFDIDSLLNFDFSRARIKIYTDFNLYKDNQVVKSCRDFNDNSSREFIFRGSFGDLSIYRPLTLHPVCSGFFRNANIFIFQILQMTCSFYMKNTVEFVDADNVKKLNSSVERVFFKQLYMIDIDSKLLNPEIFQKIAAFVVAGHLRSIEARVFVPFERLRSLTFYTTSIMELIRRQGIEWMKGINARVRVNVKNQTDLRIHRKNLTQVVIKSDRFERYDLNSFKNDDADFCLFVDFPFKQMVFIKEDIYDPDANEEIILYSNFSFTCTQLWLYQFNSEMTALTDFYYPTLFDKALNASNFMACEFEKRIKMCNRSQYHISTSKRPTYTWFDVIIGLEFSFSIILPVLFGSFGIVTNIIVIRVIFHEKNVKSMRKKQYIYMSLHCLSNVLICVIQFMNLLNECQYPYSGLFCSSVRHLVGIQYLRIIFGEYFNSVLRLVSNFTYFGFSICRLAKIGTEHSKFTNFVNKDLHIMVFVGIVLFFSACLSVCKSLQYDINYDYPDLAFPLPFFQNSFKRDWIHKSGYVAIFLINMIYNLVNYFLFVLVHLIVDLILIKKLWQVMREKEKKMQEMKRSEKEFEKTSKENEESKRRAVIMVICNSTLNFCLKIPLLIPALNDVRILNHDYNLFYKHIPVPNELNLFSSPFNFKFYCMTEKSCQIFQSFGNCLFLVSLSTILFFLKHFDMNFKSALKNVFHETNKNSVKDKILLLVPNLPANSPNN